MAKKNTQIIFVASILIISFFLDQPLFNLMQVIGNPVLDKIMLWFSNELTVFTILIIISALFMYQERKTNYISVLLMSFLSGFIISYLLKFLVMRPRPFGIPNINIALSKYSFNLPDYSFPSTHATSSFSVLPVLDKEFKKLQYFWIFFAVMVAISRIYLNEHYLSDVIAGAILGYIIGYYVLKKEAKYGIARKFFHKI